MPEHKVITIKTNSLKEEKLYIVFILLLIRFRSHKILSQFVWELF